jgi:threonine dehydratase
MPSSEPASGYSSVLGSWFDAAEVSVAQQRLRGVAVVTPVVEPTAIGVALKLESLQRSGSFKFRGAANAVRAFDATRVVTGSSGNHALGLAAAAGPGVSVTAVMQQIAPLHKRRIVADAGVDVRLCSGDMAARDALARALALELDARYIPASDDARVIAGQATVALEIVEQRPSTRCIFVPLGGGGLAAGSVAALRGSGVRTIGVQPAGAASAFQSRRRGSRVAVRVPATICDGTRQTIVSELPWSIIGPEIDDIVIVRDSAVIAAQRLLRSVGIDAEPTGALALAGWLRHRQENAVVVVSGANLP